MPYEVIMDADGCSGHAVVKVGEMTPVEGGCHPTHEEAVAHSQALNLATMDEEQASAEPGALGAGSQLDAAERKLNAVATQKRAIDLSAPGYMRENALRGLKYHEQGLGGVLPQTVEDARAMARGQISERKWRKIGPWIARHLVDLESAGAKAGEITPGVVAHLLWGSGTSKSAAERTMTYANSIVAQLDKERSMTDVIIEATRAEADDLSVGDMVRWDSSGGTAYGVITEKTASGSVSAEPEGPSMEGTEDEPALQVTVYSFDGEEWEATETKVVHRAEALTVIQSFPADRNGDEIHDEEDDEAMRSNKWISKNVEGRRIGYSQTEVRAMGDGNTLVGYAAVFDSPSEPLPFKETVMRGAFAKTLKDGADVRLLIDHEGVPLARTKSGTMKLMEDERGLKVEAELDPTNPDAARVLSAMRRGDLSQMSFAFDAVRDSWSANGQERELQEVRLYDVSVVTFPAYEETIAEVRRLCEQPVSTMKTTSLRKWARVIQIMKTKTQGGSK
jgi:HK97 family phage prohead protease